jgi:hypothetical protein
MFTLIYNAPQIKKLVENFGFELINFRLRKKKSNKLTTNMSKKVELIFLTLGFKI